MVFRLGRFSCYPLGCLTISFLDWLGLGSVYSKGLAGKLSSFESLTQNLGRVQPSPHSAISVFLFWFYLAFSFRSPQCRPKRSFSPATKAKFFYLTPNLSSSSGSSPRQTVPSASTSKIILTLRMDTSCSDTFSSGRSRRKRKRRRPHSRLRPTAPSLAQEPWVPILPT